MGNFIILGNWSSQPTAACIVSRFVPRLYDVIVGRVKKVSYTSGTLQCIDLEIIYGSLRADLFILARLLRAALILRDTLYTYTMQRYAARGRATDSCCIYIYILRDSYAIWDEARAAPVVNNHSSGQGLIPKGASSAAGQGRPWVILSLLQIILRDLRYSYAVHRRGGAPKTHAIPERARARSLSKGS